MGKPSYIYWFAYYNIESISVRYRGTYVLDELRNGHGIPSAIVYPGYSPGKVFKFLFVFISALWFRKKDSVIVIQKLYTKGPYCKWLKYLIRKQPDNTIYDIDDAEYVKFGSETIDHFMENCSMTIVASEALEQYATKRSNNVVHLTSPVIDHDLIKKKRNEVIIVGWIGWHGIYHKEAMATTVFPALKELEFSVRFVMLGVRDRSSADEIVSEFAEYDHIQVDIPLEVNWLDELSVYEIVKGFDVSVAPLLNNEIHRAKSAFKLKQCFSCGVPGLASRIGENNTFLIDGENGFFCDDHHEFAKRLRQIKSMSDVEYEALMQGSLNSIPSFSMSSYGNWFLNSIDQLIQG